MAKQKLSNKRIILIIAVVFALIAVFATIYWIIESPKTATVDVVVAPVSANVKIGGVQYHNGQHRIEMDSAVILAQSRSKKGRPKRSTSVFRKTKTILNTTKIMRNMRTPAGRLKNTNSKNLKAKNTKIQSFRSHHSIVTVVASISTLTLPKMTVSILKSRL